jgi:hypothetical protein
MSLYNTSSGFKSRSEFRADPPRVEESLTIAQGLVNTLNKFDQVEVDDLSSHFTQRITLQSNAVDEWFRMQDNVFGKYQRYKQDFNSEKFKAD